MCSIRGWLPIVKDLEEEVKALGLEMKLDVSDKDEIWVFNNYKEEFNNDILVQQRPIEVAGLPMVPLRDYAVANKYFIFYEPGTSASAIKFRSNVHEWSKPNMPILGWGPGDEGGHIGFASQFGQFPIPSDFSMNLSVFNADLFQIESLEQNDFEPIVPEAGKHYVAFGRSDGDNISVWANEFPLSSADFGGAEGGFPMSWSIQPSLIDIAPGMMNIIYKNARDTDYFIAPVSGHGYIYPSTYPKEQYDDWFTTLDSYLGRTDLSVVEILDLGKGDILDKNIANQYAQCENLLGGICLNGNRYAGGQGAVIWSDNGKPFIAPRETLWTEQKELVAARINSYETDYTKIEGYTFVNLHPWSHTYQDVEWVVNNLDEDVVVVSPEQLLDLISKNVAKVDVTSLQTSSTPIIVPFDANNNKFLLDTEDWKGDVSQESSMLAIQGTATKTYTLPTLDDLVIEFQYQAVGIDSQMTVLLEMDDEVTTIANNLPVYRNEGLNSMFIPLDLYFDEYQGKEVTLTVKTANTEQKIRIDSVITATKTYGDATSAGDKLHDSFTETIEDWGSTSFEKGAYVKFDNNMIIMDGSDGWTGLFNAHVNNAAYKYFVMPDTDLTRFNLSIRSTDMGTDVKATLILDGEVVELTEGYEYISNYGYIDINMVLENHQNAKALLIVQQKDSNKNNGIGEACYIQKFNVDAYSIDPNDNRFDVDLEDWTVASGNVSHAPGQVVFNGAGSIEKTYIFGDLADSFNFMPIFKFAEIGSGMKAKLVVLENDSVLYESSEVSCDSEVSFVIENSAVLEGKELTIQLVISGDNSVALDQFVMSDIWTIDVYNNQFEDGMEDWVSVSATGWENNKVYKDPNWPRLQFTYALNGSVVGSKTYTLLNTRDIILEASIEGSGALAGMLKYELVIGENTYTIYEGQIAAGVNTVQIALANIEALKDVAYEGAEVTVKMTVTQMDGGAGDCWLWSFVTKEGTVAEPPKYDVYDNQFDTDMEDWVLESATGWESNSVYKDPNWPRLQVTYALNGSVTASKTYTLLNTRNIVLEASIEGQGDLAGMLKYELVIGENTYTIYDAQIAAGVNTVSIALHEVEALKDVAYEGAEVTVLMTVTQMDGGAGDCWLWSFVTKEVVVEDPTSYIYNNQFDTDMEDWVSVSATGWENNKVYKDPNWPRLQVTYALNGSVTASKTYTLFDTRNIVLEASIEGQGDLAGMLKYELVVAGTTYTIYEEQIAAGVNTVSIALHEVEALKDVAYEGAEVTVLMTVTQMDGGAGDCWLWSFVTKEA